MVFHAIVDRALNGDTLILALLKKSVTAVQAVSADISIRAGWEVTKNALKAHNEVVIDALTESAEEAYERIKKIKFNSTIADSIVNAAYNLLLQVSAQSMSAKLMAAPEIVAYVPACVASYQGGGAFMLKYTPCPAVFSGSVDMKDPTDTSAYSKSSNEMLNLLSEAKTYEVNFRSRIMRATETLYYSTHNLFNSKHVLTKAIEFPSKYVSDVSLEYSEKEAAAMVCGLYTHTKKLEVSELFSVAISMDHHYGHLSHFGLVLSAPPGSARKIYSLTPAIQLYKPHSEALEAHLAEFNLRPPDILALEVEAASIISTRANYGLFSQRMGMPTHDYRISPAVAESAGIVEVFRVCALEQFDSDYNLVRATIKNMGELGGSLTNYRLAFQSYLTGLDTAMTDFARRLVDKRREVRMAIADQEARAASQQAVGN
jgi:hypothetical protein